MSNPSQENPSTSQVDARFLRELSELFTKADVTGSQALDTQRVNSYWRAGKKIATLKNGTRALLRDIAGRINKSYGLVQRCRQFYHTWETGLSPQAEELSWSKHILLLTVGDKKVRSFYIDQTVKQGWSCETLRRAIRQNVYDKAKDKTFLPAVKPQILNYLHIYKATLKRVIDGDTLEVLIDVGFHLFVTVRVRLSGINCAEMGTKANRNAQADAAKAFVTQKLSACPFIVIQTFKTDIYDRYIADVYYHPTIADKEGVIKNGFYLNRELLEAGLAKGMLV